MRHASWGNSECGPYRRCGSSVKVCVTHLRIRSELVFFLEGLICGIECTVSARRIVKKKIAKYAQAVSRAWSFPAGASSSQSKA